jgi:hypothetical protein
MTLEEAAEAQREAADRLVEAPDGWLVCQASQFPPPPRPPLQEEIERWYLAQGYRLTRTAASP